MTVSSFSILRVDAWLANTFVLPLELDDAAKSLKRLYEKRNSTDVMSGGANRCRRMYISIEQVGLMQKALK